MLPQELQRAIDEVERKIEVNRSGRDTFLFERCIEAWCETLGWKQDSQVIVSIFRGFYRDNYFVNLIFGVKISSVLSDGVKFDNLREIVNLWNGRHNGKAIEELMSKMNSRDYILFAFAITAVGYAVYRLRKMGQEKKVEAPSKPAPVRASRRVLVLVINVRHGGVIETLRAHRMADLKPDQLYDATQALWLGDEAAFNTTMSGWFEKNRAVSEPSEYDVYLVRFDLLSDDEGFHPNVNQVDRNDAFRRLQSKHHEIKVSERLPSQAYGETGTYRR